VAITVSWVEHNRPYSISADTMLDGISVFIEVEVEAEQE
jgi:hypothetical protein